MILYNVGVPLVLKGHKYSLLFVTKCGVVYMFMGDGLAGHSFDKQ